MKATCSIAGCADAVKAHGWCQRHYFRWRRTGDPTATKRPKRPHETVKRLVVGRGGVRGACTLADCGRPHYALGMCRMHYQRKRRHGDALYERTDVSRFWVNVDKNGPIPSSRPDLGPCYIWTGQIHKRDGYGRHTVNGKFVQAHRFACEIETGPLPDGYDPDHLCRVRPCVRRSHLEVVTSLENWWRSEAPSAINARKTHCKYGHPFSGANLYVHPKTGHRGCRICRARNSHESAIRRRAARAA